MTIELLLKKLEDIIAINKSVHLEYHGRPDCKSCALAEVIEDLIKEAKDGKKL